MPRKAKAKEPPTPVQLSYEIQKQILALYQLRDRALLLPTARTCAAKLGDAIIALSDADEKLSDADHFGNG